MWVASKISQGNANLQRPRSSHAPAVVLLTTREQQKVEEGFNRLDDDVKRSTTLLRTIAGLGCAMIVCAVVTVCTVVYTRDLHASSHVLVGGDGVMATAKATKTNMLSWDKIMATSLPDIDEVHLSLKSGGAEVGFRVLRYTASSRAAVENATITLYGFNDVRLQMSKEGVTCESLGWEEEWRGEGGGEGGVGGGGARELQKPRNLPAKTKTTTRAAHRTPSRPATPGASSDGDCSGRGSPDGSRLRKRPKESRAVETH